MQDTGVTKFNLLGNRQKKANALIEGSGLKMIGVDDFDKAAKTVSIMLTVKLLCVI